MATVTTNRWFSPGQLITSSYMNQLLEQGYMGHQQIGGLNHLGQVKTFRNEFSDLSKEEFRNLSKEPMIKDIMISAHKIGKEEAVKRIKEHLDNL